MQSTIRIVLLSFAVGLVGLGCKTPTQGEPPRSGERLVCGFERPEDLAVLPGERALLVSEFAGTDGEGSGALSVMVLATDERRELFRGPGTASPGPIWGDPSCPGPPGPEFSPHGIDLAERADGTLALAVVQHGGRESIELFEVKGEGTRWELAWRGCLVAPDYAWLNDVVWLPGMEGELLTTHMRPRHADLSAPVSENTAPGFVLHWAPGVGFTAVPGSRGTVPNGIEVSEDGAKIFLNLSLDQVMRRIDRETGVVEAVAELAALDNSTWAPDGRLLVASMNLDSPDGFALCADHEGEACALPFAIEAVDPATMRSTKRYESPGVPLGGGTVGLQVGRELFVGSFGGHCMLRVDLDRLQP